MSRLNVDKITGATGTSSGAPITLSGDTATLGSGATLQGTFSGTFSGDPDKKTCKACGRAGEEKRAKYPSCRPTPAACGTRTRAIWCGGTGPSPSASRTDIDFVTIA